MFELKPSVVAAVAAVSLAGALSLVTPNTVHSQPSPAGPDKPVLVINPESQPVPVVEVNRSATEPYQATADLHGESFTVPDGKLFVIEYVSGRVDISLACPAASLEVYTTVGDQLTGHHYFDLTPVTTGSLSKILIVSKQTRLYAEGQVGVGNSGFGGGCTVGGQIAFSGHLESLP